MLYIIVNPLSGGGRGERTAARLHELLAQAHKQYVMFETSEPGHATELAREISKKRDCEGIVAVGGDGTFYEVLNGIDTSVPLGLIPCGTGNDFAAAAGIPLSVDAALNEILHGEPMPYDYINVNSKRCLNVTGTGMDVIVLMRVNKLRKYIKSKANYYIALLWTLLTFPKYKATITIDDSIKIEDNLFIGAAANGKYIGGGMPVSAESVVNDGVMEAVVVKHLPKRAMPKVLVNFLKGKLAEQTKYVTVYQCKKMEMNISPELPVNIDGELVSDLPVKIELVPGGIKIFRAKEN